MNQLGSFKNKKIFLTGHTGFKGTWMLCLLNHLGAKVKGYALAAEKPSLFDQVKGDQLCQSTIGDIRELDHLKSEILSFEPDYIFHFAAQPLVLDSYHDPKHTFDVNVGGSTNVMEIFRQLEHSCTLLAITTDKVYKNKESDTPYTEQDELGGHDPYSSSKAAMEIVLQSYIESFKLNEENKSAVIARAGNVIGGGDWAENRIVPDIARSLLNKETLTLRSPNSVRPWQHVLDALVGYLIAVSHVETSTDRPYIYNFGPDVNEKITVEQLTQTAITVSKQGKYQIVEDANAPKETKQLLLDSSRAQDLLGWQPRWNGQEAIAQAIDWYVRYENNESALRICKADIKEYFKP